MSTHRIAVAASLLLSLVLAGCAHETSAPAESAPQTVAASVTVMDPSKPEAIIDLSKRLTAHHRTLFSVTRRKYTYFVGGVLNAEFEAVTKILRLSSLAPGEDVHCEYTPQGVLYVNPDTHPDPAAYTDACNNMVLRLNDELSR